MKPLNDLLAGFQQEAEEGWVSLSAILWVLQHESPAANAAEIRRRSIDLIEKMLESGFRVASVSEMQIVLWPDQRPEAVISRIEREWDAIGREPDIGEIAWFGYPHVK